MKIITALQQLAKTMKHMQKNAKPIQNHKQATLFKCDDRFRQ